MSSQEKTGQRQLYLFRRVSGEAVEKIIAELSPFKDTKDKVTFPTTPRGNIRFRLPLIIGYELGRNRIPEECSYDPAFVSALVDVIPELVEKRPAVIDGVFKHTSARKGTDSILLSYSARDAMINGNERADLWHTIADTLDIDATTLKWAPNNPVTMFCTIEPSAKAVGQFFERFISKQFPLEVTLEPMIRPERLLGSEL